MRRLGLCDRSGAGPVADAPENPPNRDEPRGRARMALLLLLPVPSLGTAAALFWWPEGALGRALFLATKLWILLLPIAWHVCLERRPISLSPARRGGMGVGALSGLGIALVIVGACALVWKAGILDRDLIVERASRTGLDHPAFYLGGAIYWITLNSLMEEYVWRWFVFKKLEVLLGGKAAVIVSALGFTAHHVVAMAAQFNWTITGIASVGVFVGGATWSFLYLRYRSIWPGYVSHAIVDMPIFAIGWWLIFR